MSRNGVLGDLLTLEPYHFEEFIADVWQERQGWQTEVTTASNDRGVDVMGQPPGRPNRKTAVQCKRNAPNNPVGRPKIQQYNSLKQTYNDVVSVTVVTTSYFTDNALSEADRLGVKCIDGEQLVELIDRYDAYEILDWYTAGKPKSGVP